MLGVMSPALAKPINPGEVCARYSISSDKSETLKAKPSITMKHAEIIVTSEHRNCEFCGSGSGLDFATQFLLLAKKDEILCG